MNYKYLTIGLVCMGMLFSCSEVDLDPTLAQSKSIETSINSTEDLDAIILGAYQRLIGDQELADQEGEYNEVYGRDYIIMGEVQSDNVYSNANTNRFTEEARFNLNSESATPEDLWATLYEVIASANIVINAEGIVGDEDLINHIKGEALAIRALAHFNLVQFYGQQHVNNGGESALGVPYVKTFRDDENLFPSRNTVGEVKETAYADLDEALNLMSESLNDDDNVRMTTFAANAIKARISNYFEDWQISLESSEAVINSGEFQLATESTFIQTFATKSEPSVIFELANTEVDNPNINGLSNIYLDTAYGDVVVLPNLVEIYEPGDIRGLGGIITEDDNGNFRNTGKYPSLTYDDNIAVIRYAEIVLLYAEALFETGNESEALEWLNKIPSNRGASTYSSISKDNILLERRKELAFEGFRFHDLARTGMDIPLVDPVLQQHDGPEYGSNVFALPIPSAEIATNSNITQNAGY